MTILSKNGEFRLPGQQSPFQSSALFVIPAGGKAEDQQHHSRSAQRDSHRKGFGAFTHRIHKHRKDAPRVQQQVEHPQHSLAAFHSQVNVPFIGGGGSFFRPAFGVEPLVQQRQKPH